MSKKGPSLKRKNEDPPSAAARRGWKYHHLGIPTHIPRPGEVYLKHLKIHVSGFERSPYGIEWMRFDPDCPVTGLVRTVPHVAFEVDDLDAALEGQEILSRPSSPSRGVRVAMIVDDGAPVELIEFGGGRKKPCAAAAAGSGRSGRRAVRGRGSQRNNRSGA
jgi:hypothetical protein